MIVEVNGYKITANKHTLNALSILANAAYYHYKEKGYKGLSNEASDIADAIYNTLDKVGYYDSTRG